MASRVPPRARKVLTYASRVAPWHAPHFWQHCRWQTKNALWSWKSDITYINIQTCIYKYIIICIFCRNTFTYIDIIIDICRHIPISIFSFPFQAPRANPSFGLGVPVMLSGFFSAYGHVGCLVTPCIAKQLQTTGRLEAWYQALKPGL